MPAPYDYADPLVSNDYDELNLKENQLWCHIGQRDKCIKAPINDFTVGVLSQAILHRKKRWQLYILAQYLANVTQPVKYKEKSHIL